MPILENKSGSEILLQEIGDQGLIYLESQKMWKHRARVEEARVQKYYRDLEQGLVQRPQPKKYPFAPRIALAPNPKLLDQSLRDVLGRRRTLRQFAPTPKLAFEAFSTLFWAAYGSQVVNSDDPSMADRKDRKMAPIPGGIQSLEFYFLSLDVAKLSPGLYHFMPTEMSFERIKEGDLRSEVAKCYGDPLVASGLTKAKGVFFVTSVFEKLKIKYGQRYLRFALLEAGLCLQNLELAATAMGLGLWLQGSVYESEVLQLLEINDLKESVLVSGLIGESF